MNIKRLSVIVIVIVIVLGVGIAARFYWRQLRGVGPAVKSPAGDIADLIEKAKPGENSTGFPLKVPDGFTLSVFAKGLGDPRVLAITKDLEGTLLVSVPKQGKVVALPDKNNDGVADEVVTVARGLNRPHGLHVESGSIYVAEMDKVTVFDYGHDGYKATNPRKLIDLPSGGNHTSRSLALVPYQSKEDSSDERLLVSIGSTCNVCDEKDPRRAAIYSMKLDGTEWQPYATGLRNSVFMAWNAERDELWATEMGRDLLGDDIPPDEINIVRNFSSSTWQSPVPNFGWPVCYGKAIHDTNFDKKTYIQDPCNNTVPSHIDLQAHSAPLGLAFIPQEAWPEDAKGDLLVAFHGSWNRSVPTGYKIVRIKLNERGQSEGIEDFITGWLGNAKNNAGALGRPVDILIRENNGTAYISDDKAGVIYKLQYNK